MAIPGRKACEKIAKLGGKKKKVVSGNCAWLRLARAQIVLEEWEEIWLEG